MTNIEFYITPQGGIMIHDVYGIRTLSEKDRLFVTSMIRKIGDFYPEALAKLSQLFEKRMMNIPCYEYSIVSRFIRCNWGRFDSVVDIDQLGNFNFEEVECLYVVNVLARVLSVDRNSTRAFQSVNLK